MRGSAIYQATQLLNTMTAFGQSKHQAKEKARAAGARDWHEVGQQLKIHSYNTANLYRSVWIETLRYGKEAFVIKNLEKLSAAVVRGFLETKIADGLKYGSFKTYCAALEKLAVGLRQWAQKEEREAYNWTAEIQAARKEASEVLDRMVATRAYQDPEGLVRALSNPVYQTIAAAQYSCGARISELDHVRPEQFLGNRQFQISRGKGGKDRIAVFRDSKVYEKYRQLVIDHINPDYGKFTFDRAAYRQALKAAADQTGQPYTGSHGLRWNFAWERFQAIQQNGETREQALVQVAHEMGHNRGDITEHYLK
jgi:site-specific recombinase XerD